MPVSDRAGVEDLKREENIGLLFYSSVGNPWMRVQMGPEF